MRPLIFLCALFTIVLLAEQSSGVNYFWLTDSELTPFGEVNRFWGRDTLWGPTRTNGCFAFMNVNGWTVVYDTLYMGCDTIIPLPPNFPIPPVFNADSVPFPDSARYLRDEALLRDTFFDFASLNHQARAQINGSILNLYHWPEGTPFDPAQAILISFPLNSSRNQIFFVEGKLEAYGTMSPFDCRLILGASDDIRIIDNLMLEGTNSNNGSLPVGATSRIALISEQNVFVANTWANGRENCSQGCHVVITALIFALNGVMGFEQMNDIWDSYISPVIPDERGNCVFTGGVTQRMRGYMHRSNLGGTGYNRFYHYDNRLRHWQVGVFGPYTDIEQDTVFSDADDPVILQPSSFSLSAYPNPFNAQTTISFDLSQTEEVKLVLFDLLGREIETILNERMSAGNHEVQFDASDLASGVYFARMETANISKAVKLLLLR